MMAEKTKILVAGAGPAGLTMAVQLARFGIPCRIVDKKTGITDKSKAISVHALTMEIFEDMGIIQNALERGLYCGGGSMFANGEQIMQINIDNLDTPYPFILNLNQSDTEAILWEFLQSLGIEVEWQTELINLEQIDEEVNVTLRKANGSTETISVDYVCACDGARSFCRHALNLDFPGSTYPREFLLADVNIDWSHPRDRLYAYLSKNGFMVALPLKRGDWRMIVESPAERWQQKYSSKKESPTLQEVQKVLQKIIPNPIVASSPNWLSYFRIHCRMLNNFRQGRVFFAGDAAHIHSPTGAQGMNAGIQDSYNLAWKLGLVCQGIAQPELLNSYDAERRPVAQNILRFTDITFKIMLLRHPVLRAIRDRLIPIFLSSQIIQHRFLRKLAMLAINYRKSSIVADYRSGIFQLRQLSNWIPSILSWNTAGIKLNAGDRTIDATFLKSELLLSSNNASNDLRSQNRLFNLLRGTKHHLIIFAGAEPTTKILKNLNQIGSQVEQYYGSRIVPHLIIQGIEKPPALKWNGSLLFDPDGNFHSRYGANSNCLYLIRPDKYISFSSQPAKFEPLFKHCNQIFCKTISSTMTLKTSEIF